MLETVSLRLSSFVLKFVMFSSNISWWCFGIFCILVFPAGQCWGSIGKSIYEGRGKWYGVEGSGSGKELAYLYLARSHGSGSFW